MADVADNKTLRCAARFSQVTGEDVVNVYYLQTDFAAPQSDTTVLLAVRTYLETVYAEFDNHLDNSMSGVDLRVDVVNFTAGRWEVVQNVGTISFGSTLTFGGTADALPSGTAILGKLLTPAVRRAGAKFFGVFTTAANSTNGAPGAAVSTAIATGLAKLLVPHVISVGNELKAVVVSQVDGFVSEIVGVAVDYIWAYQRRRKLNVGS